MEPSNTGTAGVRFLPHSTNFERKPVKYTKEARKSLVTAFTAAREHLSGTHHDTKELCEFICHTLDRVEHFKKIPRETVLLARQLIMDRLQGEGTFTNWLLEFRKVTAKDIGIDRQTNMGRKAQAAWLESLIQEFSA